MTFMSQEGSRAAAAVKTLISVVDDDHSMCRMLSRIIGAAGFEVEVFTSAEQLLDAGRLGDTGCLILDVDLPGMSGIELQQRLKESELRIPIIFISGQSDEQTRERALQAGASGFFKKPFSINSLLTVIHAVSV